MPPRLAQPPAAPPSASGAAAVRLPNENRSAMGLATPSAVVSSPADKGKPGNGKPTQGKAANAKPTQGKPANAKPTQGTAANAKPTQGKAANDIPAQAKPAQTKPAKNQPATATQAAPSGAKPTTAAPQDLTLEAAIRIAVVDNTRVKNAYLDRVVQKYDLYVAESKFSPKFLLTTEVGAQGGNRQDGQRTGNIAGTATQLLPTGARITFLGTSQALFTLGNWGSARGWTVNFTQPLLKGAGLDVNTASVRMAQFNEQANILRLKQTLMSTVVSTISAFRSLVQSNESLAISEQSLERSRQTLAINQERIAAGRMAAVDIYQTEADVASREVSLLQSQNSLDAARLTLIRLLDLDPASQPRALAETTIPPVPQDRQEALRLAFENRPDYLSALLSYEIAKLNLLVAENSTLWSLDLTGSYNQTEGLGQLDSQGPQDNWSVGLMLSIPLNDPTIQQGAVAARVNLDKFENDLAQQRLDIEVEVINALRKAEISRRQIELNTQARELAQKNVEVQTEKLKAGRTSNFELLSYQNALVNAQNAEVNAIISYLNDLTSLENTLGIVLDRWGVTLVER